MTSARAQRVTAPFGARVATVTRRTQLGAYLVLVCTDSDGPLPAAGQFYMLMTERRWGAGAGERPFLPRAFSVMRARAMRDGGGPVELQFLLEDVGPGSNRLCELDRGDGLSIVGPLGNGFSRPRDGRRPLLVGGGVGIAPLAIWQDTLGADAAVLLGFRDGRHAAGAELLSAPALATDDGSVGHHGLVTELLDDELDGDSHAEVYACGPPPMLEAIRLECTVREIPAQLALESPMACGFGACFGCVVQTRGGYVRLCLDGPVLEAAALGPESLSSSGMGH